LAAVAAASDVAADTCAPGIFVLLLIMLVTARPEAADAASPPGTGWSAALQVSPNTEVAAEPKA
jgi:hypothetical protein